MVDKVLMDKFNDKVMELRNAAYEIRKDIDRYDLFFKFDSVLTDAVENFNASIRKIQ